MRPAICAGHGLDHRAPGLRRDRRLLNVASVVPDDGSLGVSVPDRTEVVPYGLRQRWFVVAEARAALGRPLAASR